jgi:hypothetical protein
VDVRITNEGITLGTRVYSSNSKMLMFNVEINETIRLKTKRWKTRSRQAVHVVIMNVLSCASKNQRLYYQRQKNKRTDDRYSRKLNNRDVCLAIDDLVERGLLFNYVADRQYQQYDDDKESSWVSPTKLFYDTFCSVPSVVEEAEIGYVAAFITLELRDKKKVRIDYPDDSVTREAERVVSGLNKLNSLHLYIGYDGLPMINLYSRIFNETIDKGGRWFRAAILRIKNKKTQDRLRTTIDGESVVECDLDCLHIAMLADMLGVSKYHNKDIYYHVLDKQHYNTANRRLVKLGINICLNATSEYKAKNAIQDLIDEEAKGFYCYTTSQEVVDAIYEALPEFRHSFCQKGSTGLTLQNKDSWVAHYVIDEFLKIQQPILVIHDSFIVQRKNADKLVDAMCSAYKRVMQVDRVVRMKMSWLEGETLQTVDCSK